MGPRAKQSDCSAPLTRRNLHTVLVATTNNSDPTSTLEPSLATSPPTRPSPTAPAIKPTAPLYRTSTQATIATTSSQPAISLLTATYEAMLAATAAVQALMASFCEPQILSAPAADTSASTSTSPPTLLNGHHSRDLKQDRPANNYQRRRRPRGGRRRRRQRQRQRLEQQTPHMQPRHARAHSRDSTGDRRQHLDSETHTPVQQSHFSRARHRPSRAGRRQQHRTFVLHVNAHRCDPSDRKHQQQGPKGLERIAATSQTADIHSSAPRVSSKTPRLFRPQRQATTAQLNELRAHRRDSDGDRVLHQQHGYGGSAKQPQEEERQLIHERLNPSDTSPLRHQHDHNHARKEHCHVMIAGTPGSSSAQGNDDQQALDNNHSVLPSPNHLFDFFSLFEP